LRYVFNFQRTITSFFPSLLVING